MKRDWGLQLNMQPEVQERFINSCLSGVVNLAAHTPTTNILLCAQHKSASLFLTELLAEALNLKNHQIGFNMKGGVLYYPRLLASKFTGCHTISHCHEPPSEDVLHMVKALDLKIMVLTRNVPDALVSMRDMMVKHGGSPKLLCAAAMQQFLASSVEDQLSAVIDFFAADFMNFYSAWHAETLPVHPVFATYAELVSDLPNLVLRLSKELNLPVDPQAVDAAMVALQEGGGINFNQGIRGRGKEAFSARQLQRIEQIAQHYGLSATSAFLAV